jgi:DNA repair protein RadD
LKARPYQLRAIGNVCAAWNAGARAVLLVAPTGAGKTFLGLSLVGERRALWVAHRRELVLEAAARARAAFGSAAVGIVMAGEHENRTARVQVGTVQTLLARGLPPAELVILDEAHHYLAEEWRPLSGAHPRAFCLGLSATPERADGEPLGDIFETLVVAASYSELVRDKYLVPARVLQPPHDLGQDLAQSPLDAWAQHAEGSSTFLFAMRVDGAHGYAGGFRDSGVLAGVIEANTPKRERDETLASFRSGRIRVLCNVNTLTEGVDVPEARTAILAKPFGHVGGYLQAVGRVLRVAERKPDAIVIDLCGATLRHGLPTQDREYSLTGRAISGPITPHGGGGHAEAAQEVKGLPLKMAAPGAWTGAAVPTALTPVDDTTRRSEYLRLLAIARQHRMRDGFAAAKYREKFGEEPRREWT